MKHYLTYYEKELIENVDLLKRHIAEMNQHLIKCNGYAPAGPLLSECDNRDRIEFTMKVVTEEQFFKLFDINRLKTTVHRDILNEYNFCIVQKKRSIYDNFHSSHVSLNVLRKLKDLSGTIITATIDENGLIHIPEFGTSSFNCDMFIDIKPKNKPQLFW